MTPSALYASSLIDIRANLIELQKQVAFADSLELCNATQAKCEAAMTKINMLARKISAAAMDLEFEIAEG